MHAIDADQKDMADSGMVMVVIVGTSWRAQRGRDNQCCKYKLSEFIHYEASAEKGLSHISASRTVV
jgi:hypothetical protein